MPSDIPREVVEVVAEWMAVESAHADLRALPLYARKCHRNNARRLVRSSLPALRAWLAPKVADAETVERVARLVRDGMAYDQGALASVDTARAVLAALRYEVRP